MRTMNLVLLILSLHLVCVSAMQRNISKQQQPNQKNQHLNDSSVPQQNIEQILETEERMKNLKNELNEIESQINHLKTQIDGNIALLKIFAEEKEKLVNKNQHETAGFKAIGEEESKVALLIEGFRKKLEEFELQKTNIENQYEETKKDNDELVGNLPEVQIWIQCDEKPKPNKKEKVSLTKTLKEVMEEACGKSFASVFLQGQFDFSAEAMSTAQGYRLSQIKGLNPWIEDLEGKGVKTIIFKNQPVGKDSLLNRRN